jgi:hypothetical protein
MTTPRIATAHWSAKRVFIATAVVFGASLALPFSHGLLTNVPLEVAEPLHLMIGLTTRILLGLSVLFVVMGAVRKAQES